jgi:hypothetical protein
MTITKTHDQRTVYAAETELPAWARGWTQCDNTGASYSTYLAEADREHSKADLLQIEAEAKALRTRAQCEAALAELGVRAGGTCASMRNMYVIVKYADLWPLRQVSK